MEKSKPLHNFTLPPGLTWGRRRFLRCMNVNPIPAMPAVDDDEFLDSWEHNENRFIKNPRVEVEEFERRPGIRSSDDCRKRVRFNLKSLPASPPPVPEIGSVKKRISGNEDEISVTRKKLVMDFQTEMSKLKEAILKNKTSDDEILTVKLSPPLPVAEPNTSPVNSKIKQKSTYNMPQQDAICSEGGGTGGINADVDEKKSTRPKRKKEERAKFSISLSRKEIEDDFITITGKKPPRKPKKRPRNIQNQIQGIYIQVHGYLKSIPIDTKSMKMERHESR